MFKNFLFKIRTLQFTAVNVCFITFPINWFEDQETNHTRHWFLPPSRGGPEIPDPKKVPYGI
jgi:hypothetical protein